MKSQSSRVMCSHCTVRLSSHNLNNHTVHVLRRQKRAVLMIHALLCVGTSEKKKHWCVRTCRWLGRQCGSCILQTEFIPHSPCTPAWETVNQWNWNFKMSHGPPKSGWKQATTVQCMPTSTPLLLWVDLLATEWKVPPSVLSSSSNTSNFQWPLSRFKT